MDFQRLERLWEALSQVKSLSEVGSVLIDG